MNNGMAWEPQKPIKNPRSAKSAKAEADRWSSIAVRESRDWLCDNCGKCLPPPDSTLQCSHFYSRKHNSTRFYPDNLFAHCAPCHAWLESRRPDFTEHYIGVYGREKYEALMVRHHKTVNYRKGDFMAITQHMYGQWVAFRLRRSHGEQGKFELRDWE